jgi:hypothetical protein
MQKYLQKAGSGRTIDCKSKLYCIPAWRNSTHLLAVKLYFYFITGLQFLAGQAMNIQPSQILNG